MITGIIGGSLFFKGFFVAKLDDLRKAGHPCFVTNIDMVIDDLRNFGFGETGETGEVRYMIQVVDNDKLCDLSLLKKTAADFGWSVTWTYPTDCGGGEANFLGDQSCTRPMCALVIIKCIR